MVNGNSFGSLKSMQGKKTRKNLQVGIFCDIPNLELLLL